MDATHRLDICLGVVGAIALTVTGAKRADPSRGARRRRAGSRYLCNDEAGRSHVAAARSVTDGADLRASEEGYNSGDVLSDRHTMLA